MDSVSEEEKEKHLKNLLRRQWKLVVKDAIKVNRFYQRCRLDAEANRKKYVILCAREVRKKYLKSQKFQKEVVFRAKRIHREMQVYWRKREKELNEIKKRQEKLEAELKRREEEEQE